MNNSKVISQSRFLRQVPKKRNLQNKSDRKNYLLIIRVQRKCLLLDKLNKVLKTCQVSLGRRKVTQGITFLTSLPLSPIVIQSTLLSKLKIFNQNCLRKSIGQPKQTSNLKNTVSWTTQYPK